MNRRHFLQLAAGAGVATATMAEVGFFAEFMAWVKRKPAWSIPENAGTLNVLTVADIRKAVDALANAGPSGEFGGIVHPATLREIAADELLPELALGNLAMVYYDKKAIVNLKANLPLKWEGTSIPRSGVSVWEVLEAADNRVQKASGKNDIVQRKIDHCNEERLCYTKNDKYETVRVVYNEETNKLDLLPTSSLAFNT